MPTRRAPVILVRVRERLGARRVARRELEREAVARPQHRLQRPHLDRERDDRGSIRTAPSIGGTPGVRRRRTSLIQGSFASGAGTVGPSATPHLDEAFHLERASEIS